MIGYLLLQEFDPFKEEVVAIETGSNDRDQPRAPQGISSNYQEKYRKLLGDLDCAEKSAVKMEPNKAFGYGKRMVVFCVYVCACTHTKGGG